MALRRRGPWSRKPLNLVLEEVAVEQQGVEGDVSSAPATRHLSLWDLISIGVGGTVGSGIFVLAGLIAHNYAGPSTCLSFGISGVAALCSGVCYAEWAGRLPAAGSTYVYALVTLGEWPAVIAGACLTLEYGVSGAAVARSWADKVMEYYHHHQNNNADEDTDQDTWWSPLAGLLSLLATLLLSMGVQESKRVTNFFTILKVGLVLFMMMGGFWLFDTSNLQPWAPHGWSGTLRGATSSFFAFLGYDEVCCLASEAKHPTRDMPRAVLWTLGIVTVLYVFAALALTGMVPYDQISETSGFPSAFSSRGIEWAAQIAAIGEIVTLPVVVLISLLAQPRLFCAMAQDGLLPPIFQRRNADGNLVGSIILCGIPMTLMSTFVPFRWLDDSISVGILVAFNMTNSSLIECKCHDLSKSLAIFHVAAFGLAILSRVIEGSIATCMITTAGLAVFIHWRSTKQPYFGYHLAATSNNHDDTEDASQYSNPLHHSSHSVFETPLVPLLPLLGIAMNWYLVAQLEWTGLFVLLVYLGLVSGCYMFVCSKMTLPWGAGYGMIEGAHEIESMIYLSRNDDRARQEPPGISG